MKDSLYLVNQIINIDQSLHGREYLKVLIQNIAKTLGVKYVFLGHMNKEHTRVKTDIVWADGAYMDNFEYELLYTPCDVVLNNNRVCIYPDNVAKLFEKDYILQEMGVESYVGAPLLNKQSSLNSIFVMLDDKKIKNSDEYYTISEFLSMRIGVEIERTFMEDRLLSQVKERTKELIEANLKIENINKNLEKRVEEEILKNQQKQEIINQQSKMVSMGVMLENIAHQWRQPLSTILTASSAIEFKKEFGLLEDEFLDEAVDIISNSTKHLSQTIDDFRDFYKDKSNKEFFNLKSAVEKTLKLLSSRVYNRSINIELSLIDVEVEGYINELIQVLMNIINNACDEFEKLDSKRVIFISLEQNEKCAIIKVRDNAGGIDDSIIDDIFKPYFSTKKDDGGTGIGLYMSKDIIEKHMGGEISVENVEFSYDDESYRGCEFSVVIPFNSLS